MKTSAPRRLGLLDQDVEVLGPLGELLVHGDVHAELLGLLDRAVGQRRGEGLVEIGEGDLLDAERVEELHARLAEQGAGLLRRRDDVLVALLVDRIGGGRPDHHELVVGLGRVDRRRRERRAERAEAEIDLLVLDQRLVDLGDHRLVAAVVELHQLDLALGAADRDAAAAVDVVDPDLRAAQSRLRGQREGAGRRDRHADADRLGVLGARAAGRQRAGSRDDQGSPGQLERHCFLPFIGQSLATAGRAVTRRCGSRPIRRSGRAGRHPPGRRGTSRRPCSGRARARRDGRRCARTGARSGRPAGP